MLTWRVPLGVALQRSSVPISVRALSGGLALAACLALAGCGAPSVTLELAFPRDEVLTYHTSGWSEAATDYGFGHISGSVRKEDKGNLLLEALATDQSGVATLQQTTKNVTFTYSGRPPRTIADTTQIVKVGPHGRIQGTEIDTAEGSELVFFPVLPDHSVKVGDSWDFDYVIPISNAAGSERMAGQSRLAHLEESGQAALAIIESQVSLSLDVTIDALGGHPPTDAMIAQGWGATAQAHVTGTMSGTAAATLDISQRQLTKLSGLVHVQGHETLSGFPPGAASDTRTTADEAEEMELIRAG